MKVPEHQRVGVWCAYQTDAVGLLSGLPARWSAQYEHTDLVSRSGDDRRTRHTKIILQRRRHATAQPH